MRHAIPAVRRLGVAILALVAAAASPAATRAQDSGIGIRVGQIPPAASVEDLDGNAVDLASYIGRKPVLLEFWATWCPVCKALEPRMQEAHAAYGERVEFLIVAVAVSQSPRQIKRHLERHEMPGRFLYDAKGEAVRAFQVPTTSYVVILDAQGKVTYTGSGEDQPLSEALAKALANR